MRNAIKVLIVDDDKTLAQAMSEVVKRLGFKPMVVTKSTDALNVARLQSVQAAIIDVLLPKIAGVELVEEFRKTRFANNPVIFVSGVFKDKNFTSEAIEKTGAVAFLTKPFDVNELSEVLQKSLEHLISAEKWTVQSLLTRKLTSDRERAKAIEHLEEMSGRDFPFVLSILMEVGSSGALNIVSDSGEIFGVSLIQGAIGEVDSAEAQASAVLSMISKGFLSQEDWDEFQKKSGKKIVLENLVSEGYVSPHAVSEARRDQIIADLRSICSAQKLQVNFVPQEEGDDPPRHAAKLGDLISMFSTDLNEFFPVEYLEEFYAPVLNSPVRLVHFSQQILKVWEMPAFKKVVHLKSIIETGGTPAQALEKHPELKSETLQCLHYLVLLRAVMFDDLNRAKNLNTLMERYKKLFAQLDGKSPDEVFLYFGAQPTASAVTFKNIFDEYTKSNNPDQLGKEATPELRELCVKCFDLMKQAYDVMSDDTKRTRYLEKLKGDAAEAQQRSFQLIGEAMDHIRKGYSKDALVKLKEAEKAGPTNRSFLVTVWAECKSTTPPNKGQYTAMIKRLEAMQFEERKNPLFFLALGLAKKGLNEPTAIAAFEKALQLDSQFADARRELTIAQTPVPDKNKKLDIFNDDITSVVSQLFRRKAD